MYTPKEVITSTISKIMESGSDPTQMVVGKRWLTGFTHVRLFGLKRKPAPMNLFRQRAKARTV